MVDALVLGTSGAIHGGSSPLSGTNLSKALIRLGRTGKREFVLNYVELIKNFKIYGAFK